VVILETKNNGQVGIGVVNKDYDNLAMPGWEDNSLGYHTSDGKFFYNCEEDDRELETEGIGKKEECICNIFCICKHQECSFPHTLVAHFLNGAFVE